MISYFARTLDAILEREFGTPLPFDLSFAMPDKEFLPTGALVTTNSLRFTPPLSGVAPAPRQRKEEDQQKAYVSRFR